MTLNETTLVALLTRYQQGDRSVTTRLHQEVGVFVYYFPHLAYRADEDSCGEFYLYMKDRLETLWEQWDRERCDSFAPWFVTMLRYRYLDFCRLRHRPPPTVPLDDEIAYSPFDDETHRWDVLRRAMEHLQDHDKLWLKWFYLPEELSPDDITLTRSLTGKSYLELLDIQKSIIAAKLDEITHLADIGKQLSDLFDRITALKHRMKNPAEKTPENLRKLLSLEQSRERLRRSLESTNRTTLFAFNRLFASHEEGRQRLRLAERRLKYVLHSHQGDAYVL